MCKDNDGILLRACCEGPSAERTGAQLQGRRDCAESESANLHPRASPRKIGVEDTSSQEVEVLRPHSHAHGGAILDLMLEF